MFLCHELNSRKKNTMSWLERLLIWIFLLVNKKFQLTIGMSDCINKNKIYCLNYSLTSEQMCALKSTVMFCLGNMLTLFKLPASEEGVPDPLCNLFTWPAEQALLKEGLQDQPVSVITPGHHLPFFTPILPECTVEFYKGWVTDVWYIPTDWVQNQTWKCFLE